MSGRGRIQVDRSFRFELVSAEPRVIREHAAALIRTWFHNLVTGRIPGGWACSSAGQSARLISVRSEVQVFPGPPRSESSFRPTPEAPTSETPAPADRWARRQPQLGGISSVGRAPGLQPGGHRFEPGILQGRRKAQRGKATSRRRTAGSSRTGSCSRPRLPPEGGSGERITPLYQRKRLAISRCIQRRWRKDRETRRVPPGTLRFRGQVTKGARWMPWRRKAMKDVADCDKPRGAVSRLRSGDFRMG